MVVIIRISGRAPDRSFKYVAVRKFRENVQAVYYRHSALSGRISAFIRFLQQQLIFD
ncbi:hypothetical protein [Rheinheimera riviphila]|uniref:hypothetical protein n=1 Tax=Rheinheimera riviphila TaxID=1834037 RepID=UPI0013E325E0|nr:hypothetical protein [Rheinheimera riviphila]